MTPFTLLIRDGMSFLINAALFIFLLVASNIFAHAGTPEARTPMVTLKFAAPRAASACQITTPVETVPEMIAMGAIDWIAACNTAVQAGHPVPPRP